MNDHAHRCERGCEPQDWEAVFFVAIPVSSALAQTVQVGNQTVAVPSNGQIVVDGQTVPVFPTATRVVVATPPAGSTPVTDGGQPGYILPAGATSEAFTYPAGGAAGILTTTVPTTAIFGLPSISPLAARKSRTRAALRAQSVSPDAADSPTCEITAYPPSANGGQGSIKGTSNLYCNGSGSGQTQVQVTSTLYYEAAAEPDGYEYQSAATTTSSAGEAAATTTHRCTPNTTNYWKTRADGDTIYDGLEVQYENDTPGKLVPCS